MKTIQIYKCIFNRWQFSAVTFFAAFASFSPAFYLTLFCLFNLTMNSVDYVLYFIMKFSKLRKTFEMFFHVSIIAIVSKDCECNSQCVHRNENGNVINDNCKINWIFFISTYFRFGDNFANAQNDLQYLFEEQFPFM